MPPPEQPKGETKEKAKAAPKRNRKVHGGL
jgi:hypothetical protein